MVQSYKENKDQTPYSSQVNFHIRIVDRKLWNEAKNKARERKTSLYEVITKFLKDWIKDEL